MVLDKDCNAIHAVALSLAAPLHAFEPEVAAVKQLSLAALEFARAEFEKAAQVITDGVNALDHSDRLQLKGAGEFRLNIENADLLEDDPG